MTESNTTGLTPGTPTPASGIYAEIDVNGKPTGQERPSSEGKPLPPTRRKGNTYNLVRKVKH